MVVYCKWKVVNGRLVCCSPYCGFQHPLSAEWVTNNAFQKRPHHPCGFQPDLRPAADKLGISTGNIKHYIHALARWTADGMPTRGQAEVERLEAVCRECEHYRKGRCAKCGCCVNKSRVAVLNKIRMATESCPAGKWVAA